MRNLLTYLLVSILLILSNGLLGQNSYALRLKSGERVPAANLDAFVATPQILESEAINDHYYKVIQFFEIPTQEVREEIERRGIKLLSYLPHNAYVASIPMTFDLRQLRAWKVRSIDRLMPIEKHHETLYTGPYPEWAMDDGKLKVIVKHYKDLESEEVDLALADAGIELFGRYDYNHLLHVYIDPSEVRQLANLPFVAYLELFPPPAEPENYESRAMHRSNALAGDGYNSRKYNGEGVDIGIGDDGMIGPHIDYHGRIGSDNTISNPGDHGDHVSGIAMGAGNLNPKHRGAAFGATVHTWTGFGVHSALPGSYNSNNIRVTNASLGTACNGGYNSSAQTVDMQIRTLPALMHVHSAGNSGGSTCGGVGTGWRTITGGNKMGKNVTTVGNLTEADTLNFGSSRGPADDNRIKPDVTGLGTDVTSTVDPNDYDTFSGTSMSAPGTCGLLAQLYHAYRTLNGGADPDGGLMKATLLNTAFDLGNPGPDFSHGWGRIDGRRAVEMLEEGRYGDSTITQGQVNTHTINIPVGVQKAKIMVYWTDFEASLMAAPALVNDLDLVAVDPANTAHNPWSLDPGSPPTVASVMAPAVRAADHLNNMEQVEIDNPMAGNYSIAVSGTTVPQGPQKYYLLYEFYYDEIVVTYPNGGEGFVPFERERIRWDAWGSTGNFTVEYSDDGGSSWNNIGAAIGSRRHLDWNVPNTIKGRVQIRVSRGVFDDISDENFTIAPVPFNLRIVQVCQGYTRLEWDSIPGVPAYDVFFLGNKFMDSVGTTSGLTYDVTQASHLNENWFSVRAAIPMEQGYGRRAIAISQPPGLVNCAAMAPVSAFTSPANGCSGTTYTLQDQSQHAPSAYQWAIQPSSFMYMNGTGANSPSPDVQFTSFGVYTITLITSNFAGSDTTIKTITIAQGTPTANFTPTPGGLTYIFVNNSTNAWFYSWQFGDGGTSALQHPSHTYATGGTYTVTLTVTNPCGNFTFSETVNVIGTGLEDLLGLSKAEVFPNPGSGFFHINLEGIGSKSIHFEVTDLQGRRKSQVTRNVQGGMLHTTLDLSSLAKGIYFLNISDGKQSGSVKLFIN